MIIAGGRETRGGLNHCKSAWYTDKTAIVMSFIPKGDVYRLTACSKLTHAEKFESWVFDEVLPRIALHEATTCHVGYCGTTLTNGTRRSKKTGFYVI